MVPSGSHEIHVAGEVAEVLTWDGPAFTYPEGAEIAEARSALLARAVARAYELGGLPYERRNAAWLESDLYVFDCAEVDADHVAVTSPVGRFLLAARRKDGQESAPVKLVGRLNPPVLRTGWTFQPSSFLYEDGTHSVFLGSYPRDITWEGTAPAWKQ